MSASRDLKLGVFVVLAIGAAITAAVVLGLQAMGTKTVAYHTYFDESVQGLQLGAPVKYRGVQIGAVESIDLAPDRRHVDVVLAINEHDSERLVLMKLAPNLRAQLGGQGITGVKYVDMDFVDPNSEPPPQLAFTPAEPYIASKPSLLMGLASEYKDLRHRLPELADRGTQTLDKIDRLLDDAHNSNVLDRAGSAFDRVAEVATETRRLVGHIDTARLPEHIAATLDKTNAAIAQTSSVLRRVDGSGGLIASAKRASDSVGELGRTATASIDELGRTIRELGDAARTIHELADEIERDPDMLLKGRERSSQR